MRNLVSIKRIADIQPIEGADKIEKATIDAFDVVVKKGEFKVGDLCVYAETDTILPITNPDFSFLEGKRIKIKRLRGIYSYGIAFPLSILPKNKVYAEDDDVTELIGAEKWEPDVNNRLYKKKERKVPWYEKLMMKFGITRWIWQKLFGKKENPGRIPFPSHIPKTDETRFQSIFHWIKEFAGTPCMITEKVDGSSTTHWLDKDGNYHTASRNYEIFDRDNVFYKAAIENQMDIKLKKLKEITGKEPIVQAELLGPNIQGNKYQLKKHEFRAYNLRLDNRFADSDETINLLKEAGFDPVPVINIDWNLIADKDVLLKLSEGKSSLYSKQQREGIVIRPMKNIFVQNDRKGAFVDGRVSFKVINPKFELQLAREPDKVEVVQGD